MESLPDAAKSPDQTQLTHTFSDGLGCGFRDMNGLLSTHNYNV